MALAITGQFCETSGKQADRLRLSSDYRVLLLDSQKLYGVSNHMQKQIAMVSCERFLRAERSPIFACSRLAHRRSFLIFGDFLTALLLLRSFSTRPLVTLHVLPERMETSPGSGIELGWHSSISIARSGVHLAKHCNLISACR